MEKIDIHQKLKLCVSEESPKRVDAYRSLTEVFSSLSQASEWENTITKDLAHSIIDNIKRDLFCSEYDLCYEATGFLGCYLANEKLMDLLTVEEEEQIIDSLIKLLKETKEKTVLTRGLWSLAQSKFECEIYSRNLSALLNLLINDILKFDPTNIIIYETLQVVKSLMDSVPDDMIAKIEDWLPKIFEYLFHDALKVRGIAYSCLNFCLIYTQERKCLNILNKHVVPFIPVLKSHHCKQMIKLVDGNCTFVLKTWRLLVIILGQNLHSGTTLINGFLEVVEKAFKCSNPDFRIDAFKCWHILIGNFSTDIDILAHPKRLKLLIAPFKSNNAKTEEIAKIKLNTWWFLVCKLGEHSRNYFELIVVPLMKFCFDFKRVSQSAANDRKFLMSGSSTSCTKYSNLILMSVDILANLLNHEQTLLTNNFNFSLNYPVLNNTLFIKNYHLIFGCVADALMSLNSTNTHHLKIGYGILQSSLEYVNANLKEHFNKKESIDLVREFFSIFDYIENECKPGDSVGLFCFDFLKLSFTGNQALSSNVLQSRFYHIPVKSKIRDIMNGCLANYFIHKLCRPVLLYYASTDPVFMEIWSSALQNGKSSNKLEFFESVIEELENALSHLSLQAPEVLVSLWISTANSLDSHIEKSHQINQGDNSDHDWNCIYNTLMFPLQCSQNLHCINDNSYQNLIAAWSNLWNNFTALTALTATAEPNCDADFVTKKMLSHVQELDPSVESYGFALALFAEVVFHITEKFRFKELWHKRKNLLQSPLPQKKKPNPLSNLGSLVELLMKLMRLALDMVSYWRNKTMQKLCASLTKMLISIVQEQLAWVVVSTINEVMKLALQINPRAKFNVDTEKTFIGMWNSLCGLIECRIIPNLTQGKLALLSPLICVALQSSHLGIRQRTRLMWSTSFVSTSLTLPKSLLATLEAVGLPPAGFSETSSDSQEVTFRNRKGAYVTLGLHEKKRESVTVSPKIDLKLKLSPFPSAKCDFRKRQKQERILDIDELKLQDFVVVSSPRVNKRVFTKRQMEKMKERSSDIPALYNDLSQSLSQADFEILKQSSGKARKEPFFSVENVNDSANSIEGKISGDNSLDLNDSIVNDSKDYSDDELDEVLRDTSRELEKSLSDSVIILDSCKEDDDANIKQTAISHKRKSQTPQRKTIGDIKRKLKGPVSRSSSSDGDNINFSNMQYYTVESKANDLSPLASPLSSPPKSLHKGTIRSKNNKETLLESSNSPSSKVASNSKSKHQNGASSIKKVELFSFQNFRESCTESDDEIPNSQMETEETHILSPSSNRPKRDKRKSIFEDSSIYITPRKRAKLAQFSKLIEKSSSKMQNNVVSVPEALNDDQVDQSSSCMVEDGNGTSVKIVSELCHLNDLPNSEKENPSEQSSQTHSTSPPGTPCKITRSGRRVIAPNKDMPVPMTPPGLKSKKSLTKENELRDVMPSSDELPKAKPVGPNLGINNDDDLMDTKDENEVLDAGRESEGRNDRTESNIFNLSKGETLNESDVESRACNDNVKEAFVNMTTSHVIDPSKETNEKNGNQNHSKGTLEKSAQESDSSSKIESGEINEEKKSLLRDESVVVSKSPSKEIRKALLVENPTVVKVSKADKNVNKTQNSESLHSTVNNMTYKTRSSSMAYKTSDDCSPSKKPNSIKSIGIDKENDQEGNMKGKSGSPVALKSSGSVVKPPSPTTSALKKSTEKIKAVISQSSGKVNSRIYPASAFSSFSPEIHIPNGGIVFTKTSNDLVQKFLPKRRTGSLLRKCRSLDKFSPTKASCDLFYDRNDIPLKISVANKKVKSYPPARKISSKNSETLSSRNKLQTEEVEASSVLSNYLEKFESDLKSRSESLPSPKKTRQSGLIDKLCNNISSLESNLLASTQSKIKPQSSASKIISQDSPKSPNEFPKPNISFSPERKRILIISSPRSSASPVNKVVYSPQATEQFLKLNSDIYVRRKTDAGHQSPFNNNKNNNKSNSNKNNNNNHNHNNHNNNNNIITTDSATDSRKTDIGEEDVGDGGGGGDYEEINKPNDKSVILVCHPNEERETGHGEQGDDEGTNGSYHGKLIKESKLVKKRKSILKRKIIPGKKQHINTFSPLNNIQSSSLTHQEEVLLNKDSEKCESGPEDSKCVSEKESPDKLNSKLSNSVSTPERKKCSLRKVKITGTRAAIMLACAKKHMRIRDENPDLLGEDVMETCFDDKLLPDDDDDDEALQQVSPSNTPSRKRPLSDILIDGRPWAKHEPSPRASPCGSILKKRQTEDLSTPSNVGDFAELAEDSPSLSKSRRVSFADPPVSERVEIPPSLQLLKSHKAQKRLDMSQALDLINSDSGSSQNSEESNDILRSTPSCSQPLYSSLLGCSESVDLVLPKLTTTSLVESLKIVFRDRGIRTVGDLCAVSEVELQSLPVRSPKTANTIKCLKEFEKQRAKSKDDASDASPIDSQIEKLDTSHNTDDLEEDEIDLSFTGFKSIDPIPDVTSGENIVLSLGLCDEEDIPTVVDGCSQDKPLLSTTEQHNKIHNGNLIEDNLAKKFCEEISRNSDAVSSFIGGLSPETRLTLFEGLTRVMPFKELVELFFQYLRRQKMS